VRRATLPQSDTEMQSGFHAADLERLFHECFFADTGTVLVGGAEEPLYLPASLPEPARIFYRFDYFRSALHEIAHWCVAGDQRRLLVDFGYWYEADGRDAATQEIFQKVEVKPQALELIFCAAAGHDFRVSVDNLGGDSVPTEPFEQAVRKRAIAQLEMGLNTRAQSWVQALVRYYRGRGQGSDQGSNQVGDENSDKDGGDSGSAKFQKRWLDEVFLPW